MPHAASSSFATDSRLFLLGQVTAQDLLALQGLNPKRYPALLQSAAGSAHGEQHDMLMAFPGECLSCYTDGTLETPAALQTDGNSFLPALDCWWRQLRNKQSHADRDSALPFNGGWFVYLAYELAAQIERKLQPCFDSYCSADKTVGNTLVAQAVRIPAAIVRHCASGEAWLVVEDAAEERLTLIKRDLETARRTSIDEPREPVQALQEEPSEVFIHGVQAAQRYIAAGDVYQVNLSRGWQAELAAGVTPQALYRRLQTANPAPLAGLAYLSDHHVIISSSPERLLQVRAGWVDTRPIAGTRPRASDTQADQALIDELRAHPKERAEHVMLLDLERNDLGRICVGGTVEVNEYMTIESYAHVHHIVSNVRGRLRDDVSPGQAIAAVFPGGTITGCPKLRCMQIIAELERTPRGAYTGAIGYLNCNGNMDLNILIRTLELNGNKLTFRAGAGIVADSEPQRELEETRAKALGLLRAFG